MPTYKLYYFNSRGGAELSRLIFAQAGVQYEDVRVEGEEWQKLKPNTPYGTIPVLEVDGKMLSGSAVIARFLAEEFGLAGSNTIENTELAGIMDFVSDFVQKIVKMFFEKDDAKKAELKKALIEQDLPRFFGTLGKRIAENDSGWVFGPKVTYADFAITRIVEFLKMADENVLEKYPIIVKLNADVEALPKIAEWIKSRPKSDH